VIGLSHFDEKEKYQVVISDGKTGNCWRIYYDRSVKTLRSYLRKKGRHSEMVVINMSYSFKSKGIGCLVIIADRFHFCRYIVGH
jgi:transposase